MKGTIEIRIEVEDQLLKDELIAFLSSMDYHGFEERDGELISYIEVEKFDQSQLEETIKLKSLRYTQSFIPEQNWNELWESNFAPVEIDNFCGIRAEFHPPFKNKRYEIIITPKMSFGTGHHATTWLMVSEMAKIQFTDSVVADFGTGTGVLAILAEKLGSEKVRAIDIDDWSIINAGENFKRNNCQKVILEKRDRFNLPEKFDVILANINKNVILSNISDIKSGSNSNGYLLLSGILKIDEKEILTSFRVLGFKHISTVEKENWVCMLFQNQDPKM